MRDGYTCNLVTFEALVIAPPPSTRTGQRLTYFQLSIPMEFPRGQRYSYRYMSLASFDGHGGPVKTIGADTPHPQTPTRAGRYTIASIAPHVTMQTGEDAYYWAAVPFGTPIRLSPDDVVQVNMPGKGWQRLSDLPAWRRFAGDQKKIKEKVKDKNDLLWWQPLAYSLTNKLTAVGPLYQNFPSRWIFNDFGHTTVKYYTDTNHNGRQDNTVSEHTLGDFIHTTPDHELFQWINKKVNAGMYAPLTVSHGCVHVFPDQLDEMIQNRFLVVGGTFVVHDYADKVKEFFNEFSTFLRPNSREAHFYPGQNKIIIYMVTQMS